MKEEDAKHGGGNSAVATPNGREKRKEEDREGNKNDYGWGYSSTLTNLTLTCRTH